MIGIVVASEFVTTELPPKVLRMIEEFTSSGLPGQCLELGKKQPLTSLEVHARSFDLGGGVRGSPFTVITVLRSDRDKPFISTPRSMDWRATAMGAKTIVLLP